jgi:ADP-heptose:LPS heptosyltransferase
VQVLLNAPGKRGYISGKTKDGWKWRDWICPLGEIHLTPQEAEFGGKHAGKILLEPGLKPDASPNKNWGASRWAALARQLTAAGHPVAQFASPHCTPLPGVELIQTKSFRDACAVIARARLAILPEGGLHHAAASFGTAAIVIFGGYISPNQTGYAHHLNLFSGGTPCGRRTPCLHCSKAMKKITVAEVFDHALSLLRVIRFD